MKNLIPDKANCTYWWVMNMDVTHPENKSSVTEIHGYSKFQLQAEAKDRNNVLMAKIEMFYKNGYLSRSKSIYIYRRLGPFPNKQQDRHILTLLPNDYIIPLEVIDRVPIEIKQYLKRFYEALRDGKQIKGLRPLPDRTKSKDDLFDIKKHRFTKYSELYLFAEQQIANGESAELVNHFTRKYIAANFNF